MRLNGLNTITGVSLSTILLLIATPSSSVIAATSSDCQRLRDAYSGVGSSGSTALAIAGLARAEVAIVSEPMSAADFHPLPDTGRASVLAACKLKGRPPDGRLTVRLLPTGGECADRPMLEAVLGQGGRFVFLLSRRRTDDGESPDDWDLLDGGLYAVGDFYRRVSSVCNATRVYGGSCHGDEAPMARIGHSECATFDLMLDVLETAETQPYNDRARPPGRQGMYNWANHRSIGGPPSLKLAASRAAACASVTALAAAAAITRAAAAVW